MGATTTASPDDAAPYPPPPSRRRHGSTSSATYSVFPTPPGSSHGSRPRRHTHSASDGGMAPQRPKSASNLLEKYSVGLEDTFLTEVHDRPKLKSDTIALAEFLMKHQPPPGNYMSKPFDMDDDREHGAWSKLKKLGKRSSSMPRFPQHIRLPDSAISGTTTGGYRHIAISIPLEATPFGHLEGSQYPIFPQTADGGKTNGKVHVRTSTNEKGVVTVLRTVSEDRESQSPTLAHFNVSSGTAFSDLRRRSKSPFSASKSATGSEVKRNSTDGKRSSGSPGPQATRSFNRSLYPARGSSFANAALQQQQPQVSIDGMIATDSSPSSQTPDGPAQHLIAETATSGQRQDASSTADRPLSSQTEKSMSAASGSALSRKELVRDRKRRDIEAMKNAKQRKADQEQKQQNIAFAPIRIVVDLEPTDSPATGIPDNSKPTRPRSAPMPLKLNSESAQVDDDGYLVPAIDQEPPLTPDRESSSDAHRLSQRRRQDRQSRDMKEAARLKANRLLAAATAPQEDPAASSQADKEILRLYEAYRDHRLREMERRLRRLERNGDVWLRALVPVLDTVHRSMTAPPPRSRHRRSYASEEGEGGLADEPEKPVYQERNPRRVSKQPQHQQAARRGEWLEASTDEVRGRSANKRPTSASQGKLIESLSRRLEEDAFLDELDLDSEDSEGEGTGLNTIEPLMRELAADASSRQRRAAMTATAGRAKRSEDTYRY